MQNLKNRFKDEDKQRVWIDHQFCCLCRSNQNCSIHHIYGTISDSLFNSAMLCHACHLKADTVNFGCYRGIGLRRQLLKIAMKRVVNSGYKIEQKDLDFLENVKDDVQYILSSV